MWHCGFYPLPRCFAVGRKRRSTSSIAPLRSNLTPRYHLHRANLLYRLGRLDDAADAFGRAAELDPTNPDAKRSQLTVYYDNGRFTEALAIGGELIRFSAFR
jgi:tetratricopeptide (TPR) repeat protein